jgi:hypothetical protein
MKKIAVIVLLSAVLAAGLVLIGCDDPEYTDKSKPSQHEGKLLILQAYGTSDDAAGVSHSFVELYNTTSNDIKLDGISLYYADGERGLDIKQDWAWARLDLTGTIPAKHSYLILGKNEGSPNARLKLKDEDGDIYKESFSLGNRSFKVAIIEGKATLNMANPFNTDKKGKKVDGYIDMVGAANDPNHATNPDNIFGYEKAPARNSASEAVRRKNLTDTNDNSRDFISIRYNATGNASVNAHGIPGVSIRIGEEDWKLEHYRPKNTDHGVWNPVDDPLKPETEESETLMILQANRFGNDNGLDQDPPAPTGGGFPKSLVELYNNTDEDIDLVDGNYYLHIGNNSTENNGWTYVIQLTGIIPAKSSFLIVSNNADEVNDTPRALLPTADQEADFRFTNGQLKVAVLKNQSALLTVNNPFTEESLESDYVDMLGAGGSGVTGFENTRASISAPQGPRRTSLTDSNNNGADFAQVDFRGNIGNRGMPDGELYKFWPRNSDEAWDPITGLPAIHPKITEE